MSRHPRAAHAIGMSDGDGSARDVQPLVRNAEPVSAVEDLTGERLVQLPEIDIVDLQSMYLEQLWYREDGTDPHFIGIAPRHRHAPIGAKRLQAAPAGFLCAHEHHGRGAIGELAAVAGRDRPAGLQHLATRVGGRQAGYRLRGRAGTHSLILSEPHLTKAGFARRLVCDDHPARERYDLIAAQTGT